MVYFLCIFFLSEETEEVVTKQNAVSFDEGDLFETKTFVASGFFFPFLKFLFTFFFFFCTFICSVKLLYFAIFAGPFI
jgi:hypothetical protein